MESTNVSTSSLHKAIAAIAEYLEDEFSPDLFGFLDGGTTLEIMSEAFLQRAASLEKEQLKAQTDIEKEELKQQRQRADVAADNEVEPTRPHLLIMGYVDNPKKFPKVDNRAFTNARKIYLVTDANGKCIGIGQNKKFRWKHAPNNQDVCTQGK